MYNGSQTAVPPRAIQMGRLVQRICGLSQVTEQGNKGSLPETQSPVSQGISFLPGLPFRSSPKQSLVGGKGAS